jgi:hypothetical protein
MLYQLNAVQKKKYTRPTWDQQRRQPEGHTDYAKGWTTEKSGFDSRQGKIFSPVHSVQTDSEAHPASYPMGTGCYFPEIKTTAA